MNIMSNKFNPILVKKNKIDSKTKEHQDNLKRKHGIDKDNIVIVEKSNMLKTISSVVSGIFRYVATIAIIGLAFIGIIAIVFPEPRKEIIDIIMQALQEIKRYGFNFQSVIILK